MKKFIPLLIALVIIAAAGTSCSKGQTDTAVKSETVQKLKVGMMPAVDAAPFFYAQEKGLFTESGVDIELVLFTSGQSRQTALQTGQIDGAMTDLVALITNKAGDIDLKGTVSTDGVFPLLSSIPLTKTNNSLTNPDVSQTGEKVLRAGLMEISVTNYLVDAYLSADHTLEKIYINEIPARLEAVIAGSLDIGIFPEPFASIGELRGLQKTIYPGIPRQSMNLIAFTAKALQEKRDAVSRFHIGYRNAIEAITKNPKSAVEILMQSIPDLPESIRHSINMPVYKEPTLPSDDFIKEIILWTGGVTGRTYTLKPEDLLDRSFTADLRD